MTEQLNVAVEDQLATAVTDPERWRRAGVIQPRHGASRPFPVPPVPPWASRRLLAHLRAIELGEPERECAHLMLGHPLVLPTWEPRAMCARCSTRASRAVLDRRGQCDACRELRVIVAAAGATYRWDEVFLLGRLCRGCADGLTSSTAEVP